MSFLKDPHLDLTTIHIETARCVLVPFSLDGRVDIHEVTEEFCKANKDFFVNSFLPNYEQELDFLEKSIASMKAWEMFENFVLEKWSNRLIGAWGLRILDSGELNIGIWIRVDEHGKWYATEIYTALIDWAREYVSYQSLRHALDPRNEASRKLALKFGGILQDKSNERWDEIYHIPL